jgi:hypothetical protein
MISIENKIWKIFASLGIPGLALGVFYMLFRTFNWRFPEVPSGWVGPIIVLFMVLTSGIVFYALNCWAPSKTATATNVASFLELTKDLDDASKIVKELDSRFIDLAKRFANRDILSKPELHAPLINETKDYLYDRQLLPDLIKIEGAVEDASTDEQLGAKDANFPRLLKALANKIQVYRFEVLGDKGGITGVGRDALECLRKMVEGGQGVDEVTAYAQGALQRHSHKVSGEIQHLIGQIQMRIR